MTKTSRRANGRSSVTKTRKQAFGSSIAEITVAGFKSISDEQSIEIRPLTILAGANSSGKSSIIQPLLLLKQTLEASYDPGALRLNGPNLKFTKAEQLLSRTGKRHSTDNFEVKIKLQSGHWFQTSFWKEHGSGFGIDQMTVANEFGEFTVWPQMSPNEIAKSGAARGKSHLEEEIRDELLKSRFEIGRERCFLQLNRVAKGTSVTAVAATPLASDFLAPIAEVIHLPGLRGNPERSYPVAEVGPTYSGSFEKYTASVISNWEAEGEGASLAELRNALRQLTLTGGVTAHRPNDVQIELRVGRLPNAAPSRRDDWVNIADVGFGVSQALPVVTALLAAHRGQLVYLEQPETHLHPRAQFAMAHILADAANRGIHVVAETHSSLLLLGVQSHVAEGKLSPDKVKLHWFKRNGDGATTINSANMDELGRFGDWPEDFDDVTLKAQAHYLDVAEARQAHK